MLSCLKEHIEHYVKSSFYQKFKNAYQAQTG